MAKEVIPPNSPRAAILAEAIELLRQFENVTWGVSSPAITAVWVKSVEFRQRVKEVAE